MLVKVNMTNPELDKTTNYHITWTCIAFRVDLPDGDYSLVPETQYVEVLDTEGAQANSGASNLVFEFFTQLPMNDCAFTFRSWMKP
jgi:hypothetical protein